MTTMTRSLVIIGTSISLLVASLAAVWFTRHAPSSVYTDGDSIRVRTAEAPVRSILWQPAHAVDGDVNTTADEYEPRISADGTLMVLVRGKPGHDANILESRWTPRGWTAPAPISEVNTAYDELGPELSHDGMSLYFYSDRPGGFGGFDLWFSQRDATSGVWSIAVNVGPTVNSPANEYGPALDAKSATLFFASNRPRPGEVVPERDPWPATIRETRQRHDYDLYSAAIIEAQAGEATPLTSLNTPADEGAPAFSPAGDFLYFASDRAGGYGGFDIYRARRIAATFDVPHNIGRAINSDTNDLDPALSMDGFRLHFSSNRVVLPASSEGNVNDVEDYGVWVSHSREVYLEAEARRNALADFAAFVLPWLVLLILVLLLSLLLLRMWRTPNLSARFRRLSLLAQCVLVSLALHLLIASLLTFWHVGNGLSNLIARASGTRVVLASSSDVSDLSGQLHGEFTDESTPPLLASIDAPVTSTATLRSPEHQTNAALTSLPSIDFKVDVPRAQHAVRELPLPEPVASPTPSAVVDASTPSTPSPAAPTVETPLLVPHPDSATPTPPRRTAAAPLVRTSATPTPTVTEASSPIFKDATSTPLSSQQASTPASAIVPLSVIPPSVNAATPADSKAAAAIEEPSLNSSAAVSYLSAGSSSRPLSASSINSEFHVTAAPSTVPTAAGPSIDMPNVDRRDAAASMPDVAAPLAASARPVAEIRTPASSPSTPAVSEPSSVTTARLPPLGEVGVRPQHPSRAASAITVQTNAAPAAVRDVSAADFSAPSVTSSPAPTAPSQLTAPADLLPPVASVATTLPAPKETFAQRAPEVRTEIVEQMGGTAETERAVSRALDWFARHQEADGRWTGRAFDARCNQCDGHAEFDSDAAMTGLALLCYLGAGHTPDKEGPHRATVGRGIAFLLARQLPTGDLRHDETMYSQAIATVALCEAYGMTRDVRIGEAARRAVNFMCEGVKAATSRRQGERARADDTSVLGWQVMAMESARRAGFTVPEITFRSAAAFLDKAAERRSPGRYSYRVGEAASAAMTAEAMFVRQLMGHQRTEARMQDSADFIVQTLPRWKDGAFTYYWYYATLALFQHQGEAWKQWNEALVPELLANQRKDAGADGSWDPQDTYSRMGGRIYQTAVCTLSLEVYYRYKLPPAPPAPQALRGPDAPQ